ncbi:Hypothetical protein CINCED_3A007835, partial [Cinara cedri]
MFKTVRAQHGSGDLMAELEYTVLPQSDDRSLSSASSGEDETPPPSCSIGRHHMQYQYHQHQQYHHHHHHHRRSSSSDDCDGGGSGGGVAGTRRTVIIIIVMLVLGCGVVAAAVLVPILLAARLVSVPTSARLQTFAVAASGVIHSARGDYVQLLPVKHAPPGTVIEFNPVQEPPPSSLPPANRRKRRSVKLRLIDSHRRRRPHWFPTVGFPDTSIATRAVFAAVASRQSGRRRRVFEEENEKNER